ncbi:MAG: YitT family protein, partial [Clostridia bacterium]|nr:YitT family protein [Clostridia bacterium]
SCSGDDALALFISNLTGWRISRAYLITDFTVLALSLSYIPFSRILYSLITVTLSSYIIDLIQRTNHSSTKV